MPQTVDSLSCQGCTREHLMQGRSDRFIIAGAALTLGDTGTHDQLVTAETDRPERADLYAAMGAELACGAIIALGSCPEWQYDRAAKKVLPLTHG